MTTMLRDLTIPMIERHESYRGRTTPEIEWRVWNDDRSSYMPFKTRREAVAYVNATKSTQ